MAKRKKRRNPGLGSVASFGASLAGFVVVPYAIGWLAGKLGGLPLPPWLKFEALQGGAAYLASRDAAKRSGLVHALERGGMWGSIAAAAAYPLLRIPNAPTAKIYELPDQPVTPNAVTPVVDVLVEAPPAKWEELPESKLKGGLVVAKGLRVYAFVELPWYVPMASVTPDKVVDYAQKRGWTNVRAEILDGKTYDVAVDATWGGAMKVIDVPKEVKKVYRDLLSLPAVQV